jgi:hypothetical protein
MNDVERIAFVTRRFDELKGLQTALAGAGLLFGAVAGGFLSASSGYAADPFQSVMFGAIAFGYGHQLFWRRYRDTFGRIQPGRFDVARLVAMPTFGLIVGAVIDMASGGHRQWPSYAAVGVAVSSAAILIRDGRWRPHYMIPLAAGLLGVAVTAAVPPLAFALPHAPDPRRAAVYLFAYMMLGLSVMAAGLLDHLLLARTLTPRQQGDSRASATARMRAASRHTPWAALSALVALVTLAARSPYMTVMMPLAVASSFFCLTIAQACVNTVRLARRFPHGTLPHEPFAFDVHTAAAVFLVAVGALIDGVRLDAAPMVSAVAIALASGATALRDWPVRRHYLAGVAAALVAIAIMRRPSSADAFTTLFFAAAAALTFETYRDGRLARAAVATTECTDADAI